MNIKTLIPLLFVATMCISNIASADVAPPPEEEACVSLMEGDACSFTPWDADEEVTGTCQGGLCVAGGETEAGEETPEAGEEAPEAGEETPEAGEEAPEAGEEAPEAGEETPAENADSGDSEDEGCDQRSSRGQGALLALFALLALVVRRRAIDA